MVVTGKYEELKTTIGFIKWPIQKIIPLELQKEQLQHCDIVESERIVIEDAQLTDQGMDGSHASNSNTFTRFLFILWS